MGHPSKVSVMRWLGDKSVACSQAAPPGTGAPGSHQRTWRKDGAKPPPKLLYPDQGSVTPSSESIRKKPFSTQVRWCEPGHPSRGQGLAGSRESRRRKDSQPPNRANVISLFTRHRRVDCAPISVMRWLGDKSLACSQALPPGRVPQVRTSVPGRKKMGAKPPPKLLYPDQGSVTPGVKAFEKNHFQPRYAGANRAPVQGARLGGKPGKQEAKGQPTAKQS